MTVPVILEQYDAIKRDLDTRRFRGEDPPIPLSPEEKREVVVAKVLAAQSLHAVLDLGGEPFNPDEESAAKRLAAGQRVLDFWSFRDARRIFDEAAKRARAHDLQQRITLFRLLTDFLKEIVTTDYDKSLNAGVKAAMTDPLARLDRLPPEELAHYRGEVERIWAVREELKTDSFLQTTWLLVQARIALDSSEGVFGLTWLLSATHLNRDRLQPGPYLEEMLGRARRRILRLIGEPVEEAEGEASDPADGASSAGKGGKQPDDRVRPWDLMESLSAALTEAYGEDPRAAQRAFRVKRYIAGDVPEDDEGV